MKLPAAIATLLICVMSTAAQAYPAVDCRKTFVLGDITIECNLTWFDLDATIYEFAAFSATYTHIATGATLPHGRFYDLDSYPNKEIWVALGGWRGNYEGQWSATAFGNIFFVLNDTNVYATPPPHPEDTFIGSLP